MAQRCYAKSGKWDGVNYVRSSHLGFEVRWRCEEHDGDWHEFFKTKKAANAAAKMVKRCR